jgi:uncharacterized membrane protein
MAKKSTAHTARGTVLGAATVASGLVAGVWYAFACGVMPALARTEDRVYVEVMQQINVAIENPVFFAGFFGALILIAVAAWQQRGKPAGRWVLAALVLYVLVVVVTSAANVPLNNELVAAGAPAGITDPGAVRERFEDPWVVWNIVRAVLGTAAVYCLWHATTRLRSARPEAVVHRPA